MMGSSAYFESIQYVTFNYGDFQMASRISLREPSISINSIEKSKNYENNREWRILISKKNSDNHCYREATHITLEGFVQFQMPQIHEYFIMCLVPALQ